MNNKELENLIIKYWENKAQPDEINTIKNYFIADPIELMSIVKKDPAIFFLLISKEVNRRLKQAEGEITLPISPKELVQDGRHRKKQPQKPKEKEFAIRPYFKKFYKIALPAAALIILLLLILPSAFKRSEFQESFSSLDKEMYVVKDLEKKTGYDVQLGSGADITSNKPKKGKPFLPESKIVYSRPDSMVSNLIADGDKVLHYRLDNETEIIFISGRR